MAIVMTFASGPGEVNTNWLVGNSKPACGRPSPHPDPPSPEYSQPVCAPADAAEAGPVAASAMAPTVARAISPLVASLFLVVNNPLPFCVRARCLKLGGEAPGSLGDQTREPGP